METVEDADVLRGRPWGENSFLWRKIGSSRGAPAIGVSVATSGIEPRGAVLVLMHVVVLMTVLMTVARRSDFIVPAARILSFPQKTRQC